MDKVGYDAASDAYRRLEQAYNNLVSSRDRDSAEKSWGYFLIELQRIYNKLNAGSKNSRASSWMGRKLRERKADELLQYLQQARHSDEHGIEPVSQKVTTVSIPGVITFPDDFQRLIISPNGRIQAIDTEGRLIDAGRIGTVRHISIGPVKNFGRTYDVPRSHKGTAIDPADVYQIARLAKAYVEEMLSEAREFL